MKRLNDHAVGTLTPQTLDRCEQSVRAGNALSQIGQSRGFWRRGLGTAAMLAAASCAALAQLTAPASNIINTVIGAGLYAGDGGPATSARFNFPESLAVDSAGNIYIADTDNNCIRKFSAATKTIATIAGGPAGGYGGDGGLATHAQLEEPVGIAVDASGNVYFADSNNNRIRKITASTGIITTIAGNGVAGYSGDGQDATQAELNYPEGIALDSQGNVYIADADNSAVRKIAVATGNISTILSAGLSYPLAVTLDSSGNIYVADAGTDTIVLVNAATLAVTTVAGGGPGPTGFEGDGGKATSANLSDPSGVWVDGSGNIYIADYGNNRIREVTASNGYINTIVGSALLSFAGDNGPAKSAGLSLPGGVFVDASNNIYIADSGDNRIRKVSAAGIITTVVGSTSYAGDSAQAAAALLNWPAGIRVDPSGNLYILDSDNSTIRKVVPSTGKITTVAGNGSLGHSGDGGPAINAQLYEPSDVAFDSSGNLYIADTENSCIRKVTVTASPATISTIAGICGTDTFQDDYKLGDGGPPLQATLWYPSGVALDTAGNLYIADSHLGVIRKVSNATTATPANPGTITVFAGQYVNTCNTNSGDGQSPTNASLCYPYGLLFDSAGDLFISDEGNGTVREVVAATNKIQTVAGTANHFGFAGDGGAATGALLEYPEGIAFDGAGNLYVADPGNSNVRKVNLKGNGDIATVAGNGKNLGFAGDAGAAVNAELFYPSGVVVDASGNIYVADSENNRIRAVGKPKAMPPTLSWAPPTATAYGTALSAIQLNATASVPGTFSYTPAAGQVLALGSTTLSVLFTPADSVDYTTATATTTITVIQGVAKITWATPAAITAGTALSATQLNATANVAGAFTYSPPLGTVLAQGTQTLTADFAPTNATGYAPATASVSLTVSASSTAGIIHTFAGNGTAGYTGDTGAATSAELDGPVDVVPDSSGNVYIADKTNYRIRKVSSTGVITTITGTGTDALKGVPVSTNYHTQAYAGNGGSAIGVALSYVDGMAVDTSGNLYYADSNLGVIRKISTSGMITTVAGDGQIGIFSGDGGAATSAALFNPGGVAVDAAGNLYIADSGNEVIRKVTSAGVISTIAGTGGTAGYSGDGGSALSAKLNNPWRIVVDGSGNVYFSDYFNNVVRRITAAGTISTVAGDGLSGYYGDNGPATSAKLNYPLGLSLNSAGDLFIADSGNTRVREVFASSQTIVTVAGTVTSGYNGDGIVATTADLGYPEGVRVAGNGNMYIADYGGNRVRVVGPITQAPSFTWRTPAPIYYGTPLSATQLDATSNGIPGTITYSEPLGTVLKGGTYNLSAVFTPTSSDFSLETAEVSLTVNRSPAPVTWPQPADITNGSALSATQLDAASTLPGSFVYSPGLGTVLAAGPHLLSVTFTPADTVDYTPTAVTAAIVVSGGTTTYDKGTVSFAANGTTLATVSYVQGATAATVASALAAAVNGKSGTPVKLTAVDNDLYITAVTPGAGGDAIAYSITNGSYDTTNFSAPSFPSSAIGGNLDGGAASGSDAGKVVYSYSDSYDHAGNMLGSNDLVMGKWTFSPDTLNRLVSASNVPIPVSTSATSYYCWSYDSFGNRTLQGVSSKAFATGTPACAPQTSAPYQGVWAHLQTGSNRLSNTQQAVAGVNYDAAGNILNDGVNQYLYDAEGRICAVSSETGGTTVLTGYIYNAQGQRVSKGGITAWSCDPTANGFKPMSDYILDQAGEQVTEMGLNAGVMAWQHSNVYALGKLIATYDLDGLHYYMNDPLGTRRAQTDYAGVLEQACASLPFGDSLDCTNSLQFPTEHHFTGKERDSESGLDYFGARYYASNMGRFMSPDWADKPEAVPYSDLDNPQSLNLYSYVDNNPLSRADADGHCFPFCLALAGGGVLAEEAPLAFTGPVGWTVIGVTAVGVAGVAAYQYFHQDAPAPESAPAAPAATGEKSGEPPQLAAGRDAHNNEEVRPGEKAEVPTPSKTGRMDRYDAEKGHIREIKPDNARGEKGGQKQLERYKTEMEKATGKPHTTELTKYPPPPPPTPTPKP